MKRLIMIFSQVSLIICLLYAQSLLADENVDDNNIIKTIIKTVAPG
jgi:hypothetical protein